MVVVEGMDN